MIPQRWSQSSNFPYSSKTPLLERSIRHAEKISRQRTLTVLGVILVLSITLPGFILLDSTSDSRGVLTYMPLFMAWTSVLITLIGTSITAATSTFNQRGNAHYHLIWLTPLSDKALGNGLLFGALYRMRFGVLLTLGMAPTLILGMIFSDGWAVKSCIWLPYVEACLVPPGESYIMYSSVVYALLMWMTAVSFIPTATMTAIGLTLRWNNLTMAVAASLIMTMFGLGLFFLLSIYVVTPPPNEVEGWSAPLTIVLGLVISSYGWMALHRERMTENSLKLLTVTLWALCATTGCLSFVVWSTDIQANLLFLEFTALFPVGAFYLATSQFWRRVRAQIE